MVNLVNTDDEAKKDDSSASRSDVATPRTGSSDSQTPLEQMGSEDNRSWIAWFFRPGPEPELDGRFAELKVKPIVDYPEGYPRYASFIDTDKNFRIYRRFGTLRNRVILHRQLELAQLEKELDELDKLDRDSDNPGHQFRLASINYDKAQKESRRTEVIDEIDCKLEHYDALLARERKSVAMDRPTKRNHRNLVNFVWNEKSIVKEELELLNPIDDFVVVNNDQDSLLHALLEKFLDRYSPTWLQRVFISNMQEEKARGSEDSGLSLFSKTRVSALICVMITITAVALVIVPVCLLSNLDMTDKIKAILILIFAVAFPFAISTFALPRSRDRFAATAAYATVLVVLFMNFTRDLGERER